MQLKILNCHLFILKFYYVSTLRFNNIEFDIIKLVAGYLNDVQ